MFQHHTGLLQDDEEVLQGTVTLTGDGLAAQEYCVNWVLYHLVLDFGTGMGAQRPLEWLCLALQSNEEREATGA